MALNTTIADPDANSYCTVAEADAYLTSREEQFDLTSWGDLSTTAKEFRLQLAGMCMDRMLQFRGYRATKDQAMAWPRIMPGDKLYPKSDSPCGWVELPRYSLDEGFLADRRRQLEGSVAFDTWSDLTDYAGLLGVQVPTNPDVLKWAQAEIAFQIVHSHLLTLDAFSSAMVDVESIDLAGALKVQMRFESEKASVLFNRREFDSLAIVKMFLGKYLTNTRMAQP